MSVRQPRSEKTQFILGQSFHLGEFFYEKVDVVMVMMVFEKPTIS